MKYFGPVKIIFKCPCSCVVDWNMDMLVTCMYAVISLELQHPKPPNPNVSSDLS